MLTLSLIYLLSGLLLVLGPSRAAPEETLCRARAWVRAPDLAPGKIIQGDVRVKLDGRCDVVSDYTLGLRFAERSWVKTRRENATLPERPPDQKWIHEQANNSIFDFNQHFGYTDSATNPLWEQYGNDIKNPELWLVREEERIGFETTFPLQKTEQSSGEIIQPFAILVPSTNYPPAFHYYRSRESFVVIDAADSEHKYSYFLNVTFTNGTHRQIDAGYTSFDMVSVPTHPVPVPETIEVIPSDCWGTRKHLCGNNTAISQDEFTLLVEFPNGRHFEQGSTNNITIISRHSHPGLQRPLQIDVPFIETAQVRSWAAGFAVDNETAETLLHSGRTYGSQLTPTLTNDELWGDDKTSRLGIDFSQTVIMEDDIYTTEAISVQFRVEEFCYPSFDMYYAKSEVHLTVGLVVQNVMSDHSYGPTVMETNDEEYDWVPWVREEYNLRATGVLRASIPIFVHRKQESLMMEEREPIHYLSSGARSPVFVDPSTITELLSMSAEERDVLAPMAEAKIWGREGVNVVKRQYCVNCMSLHSSGSYYVGDTWLRKVARKEGKTATQAEASVVQT